MKIERTLSLQPHGFYDDADGRLPICKEGICETLGLRVEKAPSKIHITVTTKRPHTKGFAKCEIMSGGDHVKLARKIRYICMELAGFLKRNELSTFWCKIEPTN